MAYETEVLPEGLGYAEGPRWHDGRPWFSDMDMRKVMTVDLEGKVETTVEVPGRPSGLGWLPDGIGGAGWRRTGCCGQDGIP